jgi:hypothetical protein
MELSSQLTALVVPLVIGVLFALLRTASREAAVEGDRRVLTYGILWRFFARWLWLFPIVIAVIAVVSPPTGEDRWIPLWLILGFSALQLPLTLEVFRRRVELTRDFLTVTSPWTGTARVRWVDVSAVAWKASGNLEVRSRTGKRVRVSAWLSGKDTLADELALRAPGAEGLQSAVAAFRAYGRLG